MLIYNYSRKSVYTEKGKSIENQIEMCKEYILKNIKGAKPEDIVVYEDEGFSGGNTNRPQFQKMIADSKKQKPDYIVCYRLDRISRSVSDFSSFVEDINSRNISFICIREQFDTSTPMGRAMMYIASVFAQLERETIAERVRDNMMLLARTGRWLGGPCPTGFSPKEEEFICDGKIRKSYSLEINNDMDVIKLIFDKFLQIGSAYIVARYLADNNIKTIKDMNYSEATVKHILKNPVYCIADKDSFSYFKQKKSDIYFDKKDFHKGFGIMAFNRHNFRFQPKRNPESKWIIALGKHKGVISGKDWVAAQNIFSKKKSATRTYCHNALISGLIKCENCGEKVLVKIDSRQDRKDNFYYVCKRKDKLGIKICNMKNLNGPKTDDYVINYIMNFDEDKLKKDLNIKIHTRKVNKFQDKIDEIKFEIQDFENKKINLFKYLEKDDGTSFFKDVKTRINNINRQIEKLETQKQTYKSQFEFAENEKTDVERILKNLRFFKENFHTLDFDAKKSLLRLVINKLTWNGSELKILLNGQYDNF